MPVSADTARVGILFFNSFNNDLDWLPLYCTHKGILFFQMMTINNCAFILELGVDKYSTVWF
jgi:hypothetical protein